VAVSHRFKEDRADITSLFLVIVTLLDDTIKEFASAHLFSHEVVVLRFLKDIVQTDNVLVLEFFQDANLVLQGDLIFVG
jgi:hypothetical protein